MKYAKKIAKMFKWKDAQEKEITRVLCAILNGFHFDVPNCFEYEKVDDINDDEVLEEKDC